MDLEQLDILESKIMQAVRALEKTRSENQELQRINQELKTESEAKGRLIEQLREENDNLKQTQNESSIDREKEEIIKSKVEQMLSRLDELQYNVTAD